MSFSKVFFISSLVELAVGQRFLLDDAWHFQLGAGAPPSCADPNSTFPVDLDGMQCSGLHANPNVANLEQCIDTACADDTANTYQWCPVGATNCNSPGGCWTGPVDLSTCTKSAGWISRGRSTLPPPPPASNTSCTEPWCAPGTDDSSWRSLTLPHDFVVEGNFSQSASTSQGYLPFGIGYYRKHLTLPAALSSATVFYLDLDGAQTASDVYINNVLLGTHGFGYTSSRYFINASLLNFGATPNLLAIKVDATKPDGWWCEYESGRDMASHAIFLLTRTHHPSPAITPVSPTLQHMLKTTA